MGFSRCVVSAMAPSTAAEDSARKNTFINAPRGWSLRIPASREAARVPIPNVCATNAGRLHSAFAAAVAKKAPSPSSKPPYMARSSVVPREDLACTSTRFSMLLGRTRQAMPNPVKPDAAVMRAIRVRFMVLLMQFCEHVPMRIDCSPTSTWALPVNTPPST